MYIATLSPSGRVLDAFRPQGRKVLTRDGLERAAKRNKLGPEFENLGIFGFDTGYGAHEGRNGHGPVIVMVVDSPGARREFTGWALKASPSARALRVQKALFRA